MSTNVIDDQAGGASVDQPAASLFVSVAFVLARHGYAPQTCH